MEKREETLHDKYAAKFACALIQTKRFEPDDVFNVVGLAYMYADAMMNVKEKREKKNG